MSTDIGYGRGWLADDAAASLARVDARLGRALDVNEAGRTAARQWELWDRYAAGDRTIGKPAYPGSSPHESGQAIDTDDRVSWIAQHGWIADVPGEPWHYRYYAHLDKYVGTTPTPVDEDEEEMKTFITESADAVKYELLRGRKRSVSKAEWAALRKLQSEGMPMFVAIVSRATLNAIPGA